MMSIKFYKCCISLWLLNLPPSSKCIEDILLRCISNGGERYERLEGLCFTGINFWSGSPLWARLMLCQLEVVKLTPQTDPATICLSPDQGPVQEHNQGEVREMF